ncbi:MAG: lipopolysaccharide heptosyltransferase II [Bacteroidota bacterium]
MIHEKEWLGAKNLLCIRLDSLGDVLMTTPALRALKEAIPERRITLLASEAGAQVAPLLPEVDDVIAYDAPWVKSAPPGAESSAEFGLIERLRAGGFDGAVIFTVFSQNPLPAAMLAYLAGIPLRLAYSRENPYQLLTDWIPETDHIGQPTIRHEVRRQLDLVAAAGHRTTDERLSLDVSPESVGEVLVTLQETGLNISKPWLVMHPGATAASRRYPAEHYAEAARELQQHGFQILFTGSGGEVGMIEQIRKRMQAESFSLAGRLDLREVCALIFLAPLLISNNTGPAHIAAAVQTPVVDLYALTNPQHTPWKVPHRTLYHDVPCKFCYKSTCPLEHQNCLRQVRPGAVVRAALDLFEESQMVLEISSLDLLNSAPDR